MVEKILFYKVNDPYGLFSNFDRKHPITLMGSVWPSTEHFFQAAKFIGTDPEHRENIRLAKTPREAAEMGRDRNHKPCPEWEDVKYDMMLSAVYAKFSQYPELRELLLGTGDAEIIEHTSNDREWADGGDGTGKNLLGKVLMEIRKQLQNE